MGGRSRLYESGNVFFTLFGAVAVVGVLGAGIMSTMRGPLTTMVEVNRIEETKAEMAVSLRLILLSPNSTADGDVLTEPRNPKTCSGIAQGAGCIPDDVAARKTDAWGTPYAYCAWNNGSDNNPLTGPAGTVALLRGGVSTNNLAVALISAGPDRKFDTRCQDSSTFVTPGSGGGDDIVRTYNYNDAVAGTDGLWALQQDGADEFARVEEEISVGGGQTATSTFEGGAAFGNTIRTEGQVQTDVISPFPSASPTDYIEFTGSVLLPRTGAGISCGGANTGAIAYDVTEEIVVYCLGGSWQPLGKKFWIEDANGIRNNDTLAPNVGIGAASSNTVRLSVGGGLGTDTLDASGNATIGGTLGVTGATTLNDTLSVVGDHATTLGGTLDVTGRVELDNALGVDGESEFRNDVTVISDVFINKTATGGGNLNVEDSITADEGNITAEKGDIIATEGNIEATDGDVTAGGNVSAGDSITAENDITATTGNIAATAGNVTAGGDVVAGGKVIGDSFHRGEGSAPDFSNIENCDLETEKLVWSNLSGWDCKPDKGTGTGDEGELSLEDVLARGNDAGGRDAEDFGKIGADEYCDAGLSACVSSADLVAGSSIWKNDGPGGTSKIYYNTGSVGIGTDNPHAALEITSSPTSLIQLTGQAIEIARNETVSPTTGGYIDLKKDIADDYRVRLAYVENLGDGTGKGFIVATDSDGGAASGSIRLSILDSGLTGIGTYNPKTKLDVAGTLKIGDGTELCNVTDHEGAMKYDAVTDEFYVCRNSTTGWEPIGSGAGSGSGGGGGVVAWGTAEGLRVNGSSTVINSSGVVLSYDTVQQNDFGAGSWSGSAFTVPAGKDGWYALNTGLRMGSAGDKRTTLYIRVNGNAIAGQRDLDSVGSFTTVQNVSAIFKLAEGDVVDVQAATDSGTATASNPGLTYFSAVKVGGGGDTLSSLSCTSGQVAAWDDTAGKWACADMGSGGGAGSGLKFSASSASNQVLARGVATKILFGTEEFDEDDLFDPSSSEFSPAESGQYLVGSNIWYDFSSVGSDGENVIVSLYKNGVEHKRLSMINNVNTDIASSGVLGGSVLINHTAGDVWTVYVSGADVNMGGGPTVVNGASTNFWAMAAGGSGTDTLADLTCSANQTVKWNGAAWVCANIASGGGGTGDETKVVFLTSGNSWTVPDDWNNSDNEVHVIGGGGGGANNSQAGGGGGGGAYSRVTNLTLTPGSTVAYAVGSGGAGKAAGSAGAGGAGGDTYFCDGTLNCGSIGGSGVKVGAKGGAGGAIGNPANGGAGGAAASGVGSVKYSGGNGGNASNSTGGGGGGAAGPNGHGGNGGWPTGSGNTGGGGGGGANGGGVGNTNSAGTGGAGGESRLGGGAGAGGTANNPGVAGSNGGGGGGGGSNANGGEGGFETIWTQTSDSAVAGPGGGGGGSKNQGADPAGGNGGGYGGGGGGRGNGVGGKGGDGASGIIVLVYTVEGSGGGGGSGDTLSSLSCTSGQVAAWDGDSWECSDMGSGGGGTMGAWQNVTASRGVTTVYTNNTGNPLAVSIILDAIGLTQQRSSLVVDGLTIATITPSDYYSTTAATAHYSTLNGMVPVGATYQLVASNGIPTIIGWHEATFGGGSGGDTLAGLSCTSSQVAQWNGTAWACADMGAGGGSGSGGTTVIPGWPDAIECSYGSPGKFVLPIWYDREANNEVIYQFSNGNDKHRVVFNRDNHTYKEISSDLSGSDCVNQSIEQLYAAGKAFNFVGGDTDTLAGLSCSDGQVAAWDGTTGEWKCQSGTGSLWSDSGNGYIEYSVVDAGVKLQNVTGMPQPALGLASGMTWSEGTNTLSITGNITYTGTITDTSDRRLKHDIESLFKYGSMLDKINAIDTYSFRMKDSADAAKEFGVMAQELEKIFPELVRTADDEMGTKSVNYVGLIAPIIEATKELSRKNAALEDQVALLNRIVAEQGAQKASSVDLWFILVVFAGLGGLAVVVFTPGRHKPRGERD